MRKPTVTKTWLAGLIAMVAGLIVGGVSLGLMLAYGGGYSATHDFVPTYDGFFWAVIGLMVVGFTAAAVGGVVQIVAWIGALINTFQIEDKTWFAVLLAGGILGFAFALVGFAAMVAYLIAGPDGMALREPRMPTYPPYPQQPMPYTPAS